MMMVTDRVKDVREWFCHLKETGEYVTDKTGCKMLELIGATFIADEPAIFGTVNQGYVVREIEWYKSMSLNVNDIPGGPPKAWVTSASPTGMINSNYGFLVYSKENGNQFDNVYRELRANPESRRAVMVYTRPQIWSDYNKDGMSDFICTNSAQYLIRDGKLDTIVQMRSNDLIFGYRNDAAWHDYVRRSLAESLGVEVGKMLWHAGSLHVYERHFDLVKT